MVWVTDLDTGKEVYRTVCDVLIEGEMDALDIINTLNINAVINRQRVYETTYVKTETYDYEKIYKYKEQ